MGLSAKAELNEYGDNYHAPEATLHGTPHAPVSRMPDTSTVTAVSWGAILAGATAASALALVLFLLGVGLGLSSMSPWTNNGASASTLGVSAILWLSFTQVVAYGMGGYLAGRLRTRWLTAHADEVYFRDTAHGFLTWAVASLATAVLLTSAISSIIDTGVKSAAVLSSDVLNNPSANVVSESIIQPSLNPMPIASTIDYFINVLFRKNSDAADVATSERNINVSNNTKSDIAIIFINAIRNGGLPTADITYVSQLVSDGTGLSQSEAKKRVTSTYSKLQSTLRGAEQLAKQAADTARKASAYAALWMFISLLMGAFVASWAATCGGRNRDT